MTRETSIIHIVDDDEAFRNSVQWLLESVGMNVLVHESATDFLKIVNTDTVGCLITDVRMPGMSGLELQQAMRTDEIDLPVIVMTAHGDVDTAVQAMKAGAMDVVLIVGLNVLSVVPLAAAVAASVERSELRHFRVGLERRIASLSTRESEVINLIVAGNTNKATARKLGLAEKTALGNSRLSKCRDAVYRILATSTMNWAGNPIFSLD